MGCINEKTYRKIEIKDNDYQESEIEKNGHVRRRTQHFMNNLVHEEYRKKIDEVYDITSGKILGTGISGMVRVVKHIKTGRLHAMKTLHLDRVKNKNEVRREIHIMSKVNHPNIIRLYETYESDDHLFMIMELCTGGELLDR